MSDECTLSYNAADAMPDECTLADNGNDEPVKATGKIVATAVATVVDPDAKILKKARTAKKSPAPLAAGYHCNTSSRNAILLQAMVAAWGFPLTEQQFAVFSAAFPTDRAFLSENFVASVTQHPEVCQPVFAIVELNARLKDKTIVGSERVNLLIEIADLAVKKMDICAHPAVKNLALANIKITELMQRINELEAQQGDVVLSAMSSPVHAIAAAGMGSGASSDSTPQPVVHTVATHGMGKGMMKRPLVQDDGN